MLKCFKDEKFWCAVRRSSRSHSWQESRKGVRKQRELAVTGLAKGMKLKK